MALGNNTRWQIAHKLQADIGVLYGTSVQIQNDNGNPAILLSGIALFEIQQRSFDGFQMLAELSSTSAQGMPEHTLIFVVSSSASLVDMAKVSKLAFGMGLSSVQLISSASPALSDVSGTVLAEIANDLRLGAVGQ